MLILVKTAPRYLLKEFKDNNKRPITLYHNLSQIWVYYAANYKWTNEPIFKFLWIVSQK